MRAVHLVPAAAVLVALGAIGGVAQLGHSAATPHPASSPAAIRQVPVTAAARACPPAPGGGAAPVALLASASSVGHAQRGQSDQVELTALPPAGLAVRAASPVRAQSPGALSLLTLPAAKATGKQAAGQQATSQQGWSVVVPLVAVWGGVGASAAIGAVAGLYPALRAARLAPTDALRTV